MIHLSLVFMCLQYRSFENTVGKGEIAFYENFLPFIKPFSSGLLKVVVFGERLSMIVYSNVIFHIFLNSC